jgi:serine protease Do
MKSSAVFALAVSAACQGSPLSSSAQATEQLPSRVSAQIESGRRNAITSAVEKVAPAVVTVQTEMVEQVPADMFEQFFGGRSGQRSSAGLGSGFIVRNDGVIVTNAHVVSGATRILVALRNGVTYPAKLVGIDETNDLAVLRINARNLPVAPLGSSSDLLVGEWAIAIGNPYGFVLANTEPSVTAGVVSGVGRNLALQSEGSGIYVDMIQTDASINPGNSGGPLVNAVGEVIGVNSSIFSPSGGSIGIGFAIPINRAKRVAEDLLAHGVVRRPWIGIKVQTPVQAPGTDVNKRDAVISTVTPGSPAARAGIQAGDVLVQSRTRAIHNAYDWEAERLELRVGETVPLVIRRGSRDMRLNVEVADLPEVNAPRVTVLREIELLTLTPAIKVERGIRSARGALVSRVSQRVAEQLGLQEGDVIVQINRIPINDAPSAAQALNATGRSGVVMYLERGGRIYTTEFVIQ